MRKAREFIPAGLELQLVKSLNSLVRPLEKNWATKMKRAARAHGNVMKRRALTSPTRKA
jgi:hypothetical protein